VKTTNCPLCNSPDLAPWPEDASLLICKACDRSCRAEVEYYFLTPTSVFDRKFYFTGNGGTAIIVNTKRGGIGKFSPCETYAITRKPDVNGVPVFMLTGNGTHTLHVGQYPHCTCESWKHGRGQWCKHLAIVEKYCELNKIQTVVIPPAEGGNQNAKDQ